MAGYCTNGTKESNGGFGSSSRQRLPRLRSIPCRRPGCSSSWVKRHRTGPPIWRQPKASGSNSRRLYSLTRRSLAQSTVRLAPNSARNWRHAPQGVEGATAGVDGHHRNLAPRHGYRASHPFGSQAIGGVLDVTAHEDRAVPAALDRAPTANPE